MIPICVNLMSKLTAVPIVALISVIVLIACASEDRLTLDEYAQFCSGGIASAADLIDPESVTWGDLVEIGGESADSLREVQPPAELSEFHRASLKTLDFVVDVAKQHPAEEIANPLEFGFQAIQIATQLRRTIEELPPGHRRTLADAGCL